MYSIWNTDCSLFTLSFSTTVSLSLSSLYPFFLLPLFLLFLLSFSKERDLALRSEGVKMTLASEQPHLLGVDEDRFGAGVVLYYLKV